MQHGHALEAAGLVEIGGRHQCGNALLVQQFSEDGPEIAPRHRVDPGGRFVENHQVRRMDQRAHQTEFLLHAAGQLLHWPVAEAVQPGHAEQGLLAFGQHVGRHQPQPGKEVDVLLDRQVAVQVLPQPLRHQPEPGLDGLRRPLRVDAGAEHVDTAAVEGQHAGHRLHQAGFAGAVRADQAENLAPGDIEVDAIDRHGLAIALAEAAQGHGIVVHGGHQRGACHSTLSSQRITASAGSPGVSRWVGFASSASLTA